jgi:hypothetical protein
MVDAITLEAFPALHAVVDTSLDFPQAGIERDDVDVITRDLVHQAKVVHEDFHV